MQDILDIHTHHPAPQPDALVCATPEDFSPVEGQMYSVGIHPWSTSEDIPDETWTLFENVCANPQVAAIGECGIDLTKGGPLFRQMLVMRRQIELSETLGKPLVIHNVRAHNIIIGLKKELKPRQNWMVHGFRGKPTVAKMLTDCGIWLSFGARFNEAAVSDVPAEWMLAETDDDSVVISDVIKKLSEIRGTDLTSQIVLNSCNFLNLQKIKQL